MRAAVYLGKEQLPVLDVPEHPVFEFGFRQGNGGRGRHDARWGW